MLARIISFRIGTVEKALQETLTAAFNPKIL